MRIPRVSIAVPLLSCALFASLPAAVAGTDVERIEGFVDGSAFCDLASADGTVVEIHLGPPLLAALSRGANGGEDGDVAPLLAGLRSVSACVVDLHGDTARAEKAGRLVRETESRLARSGWERLARVRDGAEQVYVLVLNDERAVRGVTILVLDGGGEGDDDGGEVVFVNLAGVVDLARIGELGDTLHVPALDSLKGSSREGGGREREKGGPGEGEAP